MSSEFDVVIVQRDGDKVIKRMGPHSERRAEKIMQGASINLDWDNYFVTMVLAGDQP